MGRGRRQRDWPAGAAGQGVLELPWGLWPEDPGRQLPAGMPPCSVTPGIASKVLAQRTLELTGSHCTLCCLQAYSIALHGALPDHSSCTTANYQGSGDVCHEHDLLPVHAQASDNNLCQPIDAAYLPQATSAHEVCLVITVKRPDFNAVPAFRRICRGCFVAHSSLILRHAHLELSSLTIVKQAPPGNPSKSICLM